MRKTGPLDFAAPFAPNAMFAGGATGASLERAERPSLRWSTAARPPSEALEPLMPRRNRLAAPPGAPKPASGASLPAALLRSALERADDDHPASSWNPSQCRTRFLPPFTAERPGADHDRAYRPARSARPAQTGPCREPRRPNSKSRRGRARCAAPQPPARLRRTPQTGSSRDALIPPPANAADRPRPCSRRRPQPLIPRIAIDPKPRTPRKHKKGRQGSPCRPR